MTRDIILTLLQGWCMVFVPVGLLGLGMWALWRLVPHLRKTMGYKHPLSK